MTLNKVLPFPCWYIYRLPDSDIFRFGAADYALPGLRPDGFACAPFESSRTDFLTIVPKKEYEVAMSDLPTDEDNAKSHDSITTYANIYSQPTEEYSRGIDRIQEELRRIGGGKIVFSRVISAPAPRNIPSFLKTLSLRYPASFVFAFSTPQTGIWYGASPETLLRLDKGVLRTMSLAGTRPAGSKGEWDKKNQEEQRMVTDFILATFRKAGYTPDAGPTVTHRAGPVEHLMTPISAAVSSSATMRALEEFIEMLSPTPALCGSDRSLAISVLREIESVSRGMYGGWCGPTRDDGFDLFVNLRSAEILNNGTQLLHVGGGITLQSTAQAEWEETVRKSKTLIFE